MTQDDKFDLQKEAEYVLGMMDLYSDDEEIANILRLKGLSAAGIGNVLYYIKQEGYNKRIRQAKKIFLIGIVLMICFGITWLLLRSSIYNKNDAVIERLYARIFIDITF